MYSELLDAKANIVFQSTRAKNGRWNRRIRVRYTRKVSAVKQCSLQLAMPHRNNCQNSGRVVSPPPCEKGAYEFLRHRIFSLSKGLSLSTLKAPASIVLVLWANRAKQKDEFCPCVYCLPQSYITFINNKLLLIATEQCMSLTLILMVF